MAAVTWDDRAFQAGLKRTLNKLEQESEDIPERMIEDMATRARATVKRRTGQTAKSIEAKATGKGEAELVADNAYLELGTSKMPAQPFVRPARAEVMSAYRAGRYKPDL